MVVFCHISIFIPTSNIKTKSMFIRWHTFCQFTYFCDIFSWEIAYKYFWIPYIWYILYLHTAAICYRNNLNKTFSFWIRNHSSISSRYFRFHVRKLYLIHFIIFGTLKYCLLILFYNDRINVRAAKHAKHFMWNK